MNGRPESDGSDSFEGDSMLEDMEIHHTIRIPNPKLYLARQSQWKGRRGKPRCDYCRTHNLKCDREQPICNHCSWSSLSDCKYTPLPTPAHRGIPRCDRCRLRNLKCDRNLPICNNCVENGSTECNYTPKKRHKVPLESNGIKDQPVPYGSKTAAFLVSDMGSSNFAVTEAVFQDHGDHSSSMKFKQRLLPSSLVPIQSSSNSGLHYKGEGLIQPDPEVPPFRRSSSNPTDDSTWIRQFVSVPGAERSQVEVWEHQNFTPLPNNILQVLRSINELEMPNRSLFDDALNSFVEGLSKELKETAVFDPSNYARLANAIPNGDLLLISPKMRTWVTCLRVRTGSRKTHLLIVPKDSCHDLPPEEQDKRRKLFVAQVDGVGTDIGESGFDRIPPQPQIWDLLVYAHRTHASPVSMVAEIRKSGFTGVTWPMAEIFVRLCLVCRSRHKASSSDHAP